MICANATLIACVVTLYYDVASRVDAKTQDDYMTADLRAFFARFHAFYRAHDDAPTQAIYKAILLKVKSDAVFQKQKLNPSLSMYSFELLELLRGTLFFPLSSPQRPTLRSKPRLSRNPVALRSLVARRSRLPPATPPISPKTVGIGPGLEASDRSLLGRCE